MSHPTWCLHEHLRRSEGTWTHHSLPERWGEEAGDLWAWRDISRLSALLSVCLSVSPSVGPGCCSLLDRQHTESAPKAGRQRIYSNLQGRKWHATLQKQEWKAFCLYMAMHAGCKWRWPHTPGWRDFGLFLVSHVEIRTRTKTKITSN